MRPFRCALWIESEMERLGRGDGREVRWMVASDSEWLKEQAVTLYPSKVMLVNIAPEHLAKAGHADKDHDILQRTFAEWFLLSRVCDARTARRGGKRGRGRGRKERESRSLLLSCFAPLTAPY